MSHNLSAIRSSQSSRRYSPYSRPPASASAHPSPLQPDSHTTPSSEHGAANHHSVDGVPPAPLYSYPLASSSIPYVSLNSTTGLPPAPPFLNFPPFGTTQPSSSTHHLERWTDQDYSLTQQPNHPIQVLLPQGPNYPPPATNVSYPDPPIPALVGSLPNAQQTAWTSLTSIHGPEESTYQNYSGDYHPLRIPQRQPSTFQRRGHTHYTHHQSQGMFSGSHNLAFSDNTFIDNSTTSDNFMEKLLQHTIIGAEFDSSDRHPPPRCHPGTRLAIIERCKMFIFQGEGKEKMRWVVGPAGVGKSAIMQMVAEEIPADASVFFSVNGRQDGTKTCITIAYQLAARSEPYRQFIRNEISRDPSLLRKSLPVQFRTFIVDPFIHRHLFDLSHRYVIVIDGLDECDNRLTQKEILGLISYFCLSYPTSPIAWIVASRPEPHITGFFDDIKVAPAYTKEDILIDSNEACQDVQRYLRHELAKIKNAYPSLKRKREWPSELEFTKIATAAGGLFAYASTVVRYIGDLHCHDPVAQLRRVLEVIDSGLKDDVPGRDHPMVQLDALYRRILSNIPADAMITARKLLIIYATSHTFGGDFVSECNILGLSEDAVYGAMCHLRSVVKVPTPDNAGDEFLDFFHKSFSDFLCDYKRSGFSPNAQDEAEQLVAQSLFRIVQQVPDNFDGTGDGGGILCCGCGNVKDSPGFCDNISLSWPNDKHPLCSDDVNVLKPDLYSIAISTMCWYFIYRAKLSRTMYWFHVFTTRFTQSGPTFPFYEIQDCAFGPFRAELTEVGKLKQVPLRALDFAAICGGIHLSFTSPVGMDVKPSEPSNPSCEHEKEDGPDLFQQRGWSTRFQRSLDDHGDGDDAAQTHSIPRFYIKAGQHSHWQSMLEAVDYRYEQEDDYDFYDECLHCSRCLARHFIDNPDQLATVFVDSTKLSYVELSFQDPDDGVSEWRYRFFHSGPPSCVD